MLNNPKVFSANIFYFSIILVNIKIIILLKRLNEQRKTRFKKWNTITNT